MQPHAVTQQNRTAAAAVDSRHRRSAFTMTQIKTFMARHCGKLQLDQTNAGDNTGRSLAVQLLYGCFCFIIFHDDCRL